MRNTALVVAVLGFAVSAWGQTPVAGLDGGGEGVDAGSFVPAPAVLATQPLQPGGPATISLQDALSRALAQNPQLQSAIDEALRSEALVTEARASWFPTLAGNALYTRLDGDRVLKEGSTTDVIEAANQLSANLDLSVPVFAPKALLNWSVAKTLAAASRASAQDARRLVSVAVGRAYLTILAEHRILAADERAVETARAHRDYAKARLQGGVGNRVDLVRAEQALRSEQSTAESARMLLARAQEQLGQLLAEDIPLDVEGDPRLPAAPGNVDAANRDVTSRRKDIEALIDRSRAADDAVHDHWADFTPVVSVAFEPFFQDPATLTQPETGWQATAALTWTLYDGGLRYGQQRERRLLADEAHLAEDAATRQARSDVRAAFDEVAHSDAALVQAREAARLAHQALDLVNISYRAGASTNIEVIDAERSALDADTQSAVAEDSSRQARLDLLAATGRFP